MQLSEQRLEQKKMHCEFRGLTVRFLTNWRHRCRGSSGISESARIIESLIGSPPGKSVGIFASFWPGAGIAFATV